MKKILITLLITFATITLAMPAHAALVARWTMDDNEADDSTVKAAVGPDGTFYQFGDPITEDDTENHHTADRKVGTGALEFDGVDDFIEAGNDSSLNFGTDDFSVSCWMKHGLAAVVEWEAPMMRYSSSKGWINYLRSDGSSRMYLFGLTGGDQEVSAGAINDDAWHHIVFTIDRDGFMKSYKDGSYVAETDISTYFNDNIEVSAYQSIGGKPGNWYYNGLLDDVRIYDLPLSGTEVLALYNEGIIPEPASALFALAGLGLAVRRRFLK